MLIFPLKKEWYEKIKNGEKTIEYREVKKYWETRLWHENCLPTSEEVPFIYENEEIIHGRYYVIFNWDINPKHA